MSESELERSRRVNARPSNKKPLTDDELLKLASDMFHYTEYKNVISFARLIEERHGIK